MSATDRLQSVLQKTSPWLVFALVFLFYSYPMGLSDYWWHMSSGRWIWETLSIPSTDMFSYAVSQADDLRREVILKGYWLSQLIFYGVYQLMGVWGLLLLKSSLLTLPSFLLWRYLCDKKVHSMVALLLLLPLPFFLYRFDELRPHLFSFIGIISALMIIERVLERLRGNHPLGLYWVALPLLMLLWANMHRGFIMGWVLIAIYLVYELYAFWRGRRLLDRRALYHLTLLSVVSIGISLLNPNGLNALLANFVELSGPFAKVVDEFFPLWKYAELYDSWQIFYGCLAVVMVTSVVMVSAWRRWYPPHILLFLGFAYEGFATFRFSFFQSIMLLALAAPYYQSLSDWLMQRFKVVVYGLLLLLMVVLGFMAYHRSALVNGPWEVHYFPTAAAEFVAQNRLPTNLMNAFEHGGYLGWVLYPNYKIFVDQRNLDYQVFEDYGDIWSGDYRTLFEKYRVNTVMLYLRQPMTGRMPGLVPALLQDEAWQVVFVDGMNIVFVRKQLARQLPAYDKGKLWRYIHASN